MKIDRCGQTYVGQPDGQCDSFQKSMSLTRNQNMDPVDMFAVIVKLRSRSRSGEGQVRVR